MVTPSPLTMLDCGTVQHIKKSLWYLGQNIADNPLTERAVDARSITRDDLMGGHPAVTRCIRYGEPETVRFEDPIAAGPLPSTIRNRPDEVRIDRPFVCELQDVQLVGPYALAITSDGDVVLENALGYGRRVTMGALQCLRSGVFPKRGPTTQRYDVALSLVGPWCRNYYHWLIDYVTRLRAVQPYVEETGRTPMLLLPEGSSEWMRSALRLAGFEEEHWTHVDRNRVAVDRLVVPSLPRGISEYFDLDDLRNVFGMSPAAIQWLRTAFRSNVGEIDDSGWPSRIYVSREGASERRVRNRGALNEVLEEYGFEPVRPERYSLPEQIALFSNVEAVIGPTGAGMVNSIFGDDINLITLYGADIHPIYYVLGSLLGFDLGCVQCESVGVDLRVDPDDLRTVLGELDLG